MPTKHEIIQEMINLIFAETGKTLEQAMEDTEIKNEYGSRSGETKFSTFSLCFTGNENFCNGIKNSYGAGWYFKARFKPGCGVEYLKIKNQ